MIKNNQLKYNSKKGKARKPRKTEKNISHKKH